jgi:hypothetical protein
MTAPTGQPGEIWWHVHHEVLCERLTKPVENRRRFIIEEKLEAQRELRLRLLRPVRGAVPPVLVQAMADLDRAGATCEQARAAYHQEAWAAYVQACVAYNQAWAACAAKMDALHRAECPDCPWDGRTIFPPRL